MTAHRRFAGSEGSYGWETVSVRAYKKGEGPYRSITRQVLFEAGGDLPVEWRYFEMGEDGWSTLERHEHQHCVAIARGRGHALIEGEVREVGPFDLIRIPPMSWHQFRADAGEPLGFFCLVAAERDRPRLPTQEDVEALSRDPKVGAFIRP